MNWERIKAQLENILNTELRYETFKLAEWDELTGHTGQSGDVPSMEHRHEVFFRLYKEGSTIHTIAVEAVFITMSEKKLVEMMIDAYCTQQLKQETSRGSEEERNVGDLQEWIHEQIEKGAVNQELPESFASQSALYSKKVPLLLYGDYVDSRKVGYTDLKKLLESFFEVEVVLIPLLDKEWLILCSEHLLDADGEDKADGHDSTEEVLESICLGLYEMMVSEGIGECHLSIHYPAIPNQSLLSTVVQLREAISLGRSYHIGNHIHLPWELHLERVLSVLPETEKRKIVEHTLKRNDYVLDTEIMTTLERFFALDCNVSETAKKLYIHRNTLLYRLDKFKQETGLDVRSFRDAVLVKISLLLYKVTKRK
jgi:sugar diacid utilization regulator